jgi:hypothetical protein
MKDLALGVGMAVIAASLGRIGWVFWTSDGALGRGVGALLWTVGASAILRGLSLLLRLNTQTYWELNVILIAAISVALAWRLRP